ncbi:MAG: hypothetical protein R3F07_08125 [Opitutaceae bacterium]
MIRHPLTRILTLSTFAAGLLLGTGCSSTTSKSVSGAGTGAAAGAAVGGIAASATGGNTTQGLLVGGAAGAVIGGLIGLSQEMKEKSEQDRLAQERAYQQELARRRAEEAKRKAAMDEELAIAQGFQISDYELTQIQERAREQEERLKELRAKRAEALSKKKALDDANEKILSASAEIEYLERELAELSGEEAAIEEAGESANDSAY